MFYFAPHCELEQLRKGLRETLQVELLVCLHAEQIHGLLAASTVYDVSPNFFLEEFAINYSDNGSNHHTADSNIHRFTVPTFMSNQSKARTEFACLPFSNSAPLVNFFFPLQITFTTATFTPQKTGRGRKGRSGDGK